MLICPLNSFLKKSLNDQVEAWLAQGNEIKMLAHGESGHTILSGNQKRNGFEMVTLLLEGGRGIAYANQLRPATAEEAATGFRSKGVKA